MDPSPLDELLSSLSDALELSPWSAGLRREWERAWRELVSADSGCRNLGGSSGPSS